MIGSTFSFKNETGSIKSPRNSEHLWQFCPKARPTKTATKTNFIAALSHSAPDSAMTIAAQSSSPLISSTLNSHKSGLHFKSTQTTLLQPLFRATKTLRQRLQRPTKPLTITKQITLLQLAFWLTLFAFHATFLTLPSIILAGVGELVGGWRGVFWPKFSLLFGVNSIGITSFIYLINCVCFLATGFLGYIQCSKTTNSSFRSFYLKAIVGKSKQCLDFTFTCYFIHLLVSWIYSHRLPLHLSWWLVMLGSAVMMVHRGRIICMEKELLPLAVSIKK